MALVAVTVEGGLFAADLLERIGANPREVEGQHPRDFGADGARLSETIQAAFSDAKSLWEMFQHRRTQPGISLTTVTRDSWMIPLLVSLGYELTYRQASLQAGGNSYRISHTVGEEDGAPPVHIVAAGRNLDRRAEGERASPHAVAQDYLNRADPLWGLVTNGEKLRLLRDSARLSRPSYVEFDLKAIFEGNLYSEFVLLYRLAHRSRLPLSVEVAHECWLERYYQQGIDEGGRVRDGLRDGVEQALRLLGTGFLRHPGNDTLRGAFEGQLDELGYYRQLLTLIYRLLFLMVAEERRVLLDPSHPHAGRQQIYAAYYSLDRLRRSAEQRHRDDPHGDLWEGLKILFGLLRDEAKANPLGLTALNGSLFDVEGCFNLEQASLRNDVLLAALWQLSTFAEKEGRKGRKAGIRRRVNYAGLDVEELGSVYESLLDYHPHVDRAQRSFELAAGSERKRTGSYYTPRALVAELTGSALVPVVEARLKDARSQAEKEAALLSLKVCDPAAGSGHFLLAAARCIARQLALARSGEAEPTPTDFRQAVRDVVRQCLYAVDKNPLAVDLCKVALWIEGHAPGLPLTFLDHHVRCGDTLIGVLDLESLKSGIPDAAYKPLPGDDKKVTASAKKANRDERNDQLFNFRARQQVQALAHQFAALGKADELTAADVKRKAEAYQSLKQATDWWRLRDACDLWTAAFFVSRTVEKANVIPTSRHVREAFSWERSLQGPLPAQIDVLRNEHGFFHWRLEFPEVFASGGFDVVLGNPPWDVSEFRLAEWDRPLASLDAGETGRDRRKSIIEHAKNAVARRNHFFATSNRFPLNRGGKNNLYSLFLELANYIRREDGRAGFVIPLGFVTDETTSALFSHIAERSLLVSVEGFENEEKVFPGIHNQAKFCLITIGHSETDHADFFAFARRVADLEVEERQYSIAATEVALFNPDTRTAVLCRTRWDKAFAQKLYSAYPIIGRWEKSAVRTKRGFYNASTDKRKFTPFRSGLSRGVMPTQQLVDLYEGKMFSNYDHRFGTYQGQSQAQARKGVLPHVTEEQHSSQSFSVQPRYLVDGASVGKKYQELKWNRRWILAWRDVTNNVSERTCISCILPSTAFDDGVYLLACDGPAWHSTYLLGLFNSLIFDYLVRQKFAGSHLKAYSVLQCPAPDLAYCGDVDREFIVGRALELTYTTEELRPFAEDLGFSGDPFSWDSVGRETRRAELDAYYAYLYGLTRDELRYVLDPKDIMGPDYPGETFRVLKESELKRYNEYRTQRLVLEAWDRFCANGTFDPEQLAEPVDETVRQLAVIRKRTEELEQALARAETLIARAKEERKPALFVEGETDVPIVEAAWTVFYPDEPMPVAVLAAHGTKQMQSLAAEGKALRQILGDRLVCGLADNDGEGRGLIKDGHVQSGKWKRQSNGIHWCMLAPSEDFKAAMQRHEIPKAFWPFTIEACFSPALRRQAAAEGAYAISDKMQADLTGEPSLVQRLFAKLRGMNEADDDYFYLMAPTPQAKDDFAAWVTQPQRLTPENYGAFEPILEGLRDLIQAQTADSAA